MLNKNTRKQWRHEHAASKLPTRGTISLPTSTPVDIGLRHVLPLIGHTKFDEEGPDLPLPTGIVEPMPMGLTLPPWRKGDPPASIMGKLPHLLGKTKPRQRTWNISDLEFLKALKAASAVRPAEQTGKQHAIIAHITKHKQQTRAKTTPPFTIQPSIVKELAGTMQE